MKLQAIRKRMAEENEVCFGSPAIEVAPDGALLAAHDFYFTADTRLTDQQTPRPTTAIYRSSDNGRTWAEVAQVTAHWATFFVCGRDVYLLGCSRPFGDIVIFRSQDNGLTWSTPRDKKSGLLLSGGEGKTSPNFHCAPGAVISHAGRIYRAFDEVECPDKRAGWSALVLSAAAEADLLDSSSWVISNRVRLDETTFPTSWQKVDKPEWLEGNMVVDPEGGIALLMRLMCPPNADHAAILRLSENGRRLDFDPSSGYLDLPGGGHKFAIARDPCTGLYFCMGNNNTEPSWTSQRNLLSLSVSRDLRHWEIIHTLIADDSPIPWERSVREIGFQYPDFRIRGTDLLYLVRTAYDGTKWFHDANQITYHVLKDFRDLPGVHAMIDTKEHAS